MHKKLLKVVSKEKEIFNKITNATSDKISNLKVLCSARKATIRNSYHTKFL